MKKNILIAGLLIVVIGGYVAAGPYITMSEIKDGIVEKDAEKLSDNIDFPAVRQNMKDQLNAQMMQNTTTELKDNPFAALAAGFALKMVDGIVDAFITPSGLAKIMEGKKPNIKKSNGGENKEKNSNSPKKEDLFKNARYSYDSISKFSIYVPNDKGEEARFLLKRQNLSWKLVSIDIPMNKSPNN